MNDRFGLPDIKSYPSMPKCKPPKKSASAKGRDVTFFVNDELIGTVVGHEYSDQGEHKDLVVMDLS